METFINYAGNEIEIRQDPVDNCYYPMSTFLEKYGQLKQWHKADPCFSHFNPEPLVFVDNWFTPATPGSTLPDFYESDSDDDMFIDPSDDENDDSNVPDLDDFDYNVSALVDDDDGDLYD